MMKKTVIIIIACVVLLILAGAIALPQLLKAGYSFENPCQSTQDEILQSFGDEKWIMDDSKYYGHKYTYVHKAGEKQKTSDNMYYMFFNSNHAAKKVYKKMMSDGYDIETQGENYFIGWEKGVMDAAIKKIVCLKDDTIIYADIECVNEWAMSPEDESSRVVTFPENKQYILEHFVE